MKYRIFLVMSFFYATAVAQTPIIDSLKKAISSSTQVQQQRELLLKICARHYSILTDTFLIYIEKAEKITPAATPEYYLVKNYFCTYLSKSGKLNEALQLNDSLLKALPQQAEFDKARWRIMISKSNLLIRTNQSEAAINNTLKLLRQAELTKDTLLTMQAFTIMGYAYLEMEKYNEAINWLNKGYHFTTDENILKQCGYLFSNNASCYNNVDKMDSAFYFIELALKYGRSDENLSVLTNALYIRADMYIKLKKFEKAENDLKAALSLREKAGDLIMLTADMAQLSDFYAQTNQTDKGIAIAQKGIALITPTRNLSKLLFLNNALAENYKKANRTAEYAATLEKIVTLKDTLYAKTSDEAIAEMSAKYELEKKEKIILKQDYDLERNRYLTFAILFLLLTGALITWLYYRNIKHRQNLKMVEAIAEEKRLSQRAILLAEEKERKRIAADLHDNLGSFAAAISANVNSLKENFDQKNEITAQLEENAQSIVTQLSDTIWVLKNEQLLLTQLADRFKLWMQRLMKNYPDIKYYFTEELDYDQLFSPEKILHIFMIMKECVTNAAKHSGCKSIKIKFSNTDHLLITIEDDGIGITTKNEKGNGIENIKQRAQQINMKITWQVAATQGTLIKLEAITTN